MARAAVLWVPVWVVGALGLALSLLVTPPQGASHSCPSGASTAACNYPGDQTTFSIVATAGGLVLGLCVGVLLRAEFVRRRDAREAADR